MPAVRALRDGPVQVREFTPPPRPSENAGTSLVVDYGFPAEERVGPSEEPGGLPEGGRWAGSDVVGQLEPAGAVFSVTGPIGVWEISAIGLYEDLPFELPPLGSETAELDDSLETAMPIIPAGPVAIAGSLGPMDQVDFFKIDTKEGVYQLAFGNTLPTARGGQRIVLMDQHGQTLHSLVMPSGKSVLTVDLQLLQPPGEPLFVGIARESEGAGASASGPSRTETESYWMFVQPVSRQGAGSGSSWYDFEAGMPNHDGDHRGKEGVEDGPDATSEESGSEVTVAANEMSAVSVATGLPTGPLPRMAAGLNRGLLSSSFVVGRVSPIEGLALDLPTQVLEGDSGGSAAGEVLNPGPVVPVRGAHLPLLAAANLSTPAAPPASNEAAENGGGTVEEVAEVVGAEVEVKASRRLPAGLGLATVLAVSLMLPDFTGIRPGAYLKRRLGLGAGGPRRGAP